MSVEVAVIIDDKDFKAMMKRLGDLAEKKGKEILHAMALYWQREIDRTFEKEGARQNLPHWPDFKTSTLINTKTGTWKIRYGTDLLPYGSPGKYVRGARRYGFGSKLLQAGGMLKGAFSEIRHPSNDRVIVGSRERITDKRGTFDASDLIKGRPVITVTELDRDAMAKTLINAIRAAVSK